MIFGSVLFLCLFLPVTLGLYHVLPARWKNALLLLASLAFYAFGEPVYVLLMVFSILLNYTGARLLEGRAGRGGRKAVLAVCVVLNVGLLCLFKYGDLLIETANALTGGDIAPLRLALPVGISFYTFQALSYVIDVYRGEARARRNVLSFGLYICLFPQLIAGPIVRYPELADQLDARTADADGFWSGTVRFCAGLAKKVIVANQIGLLWEEISAQAAPTAAAAWLGAAAYALQIYYDFSGYSDMAVGLGRLFGFRLPENFRYPYEADSVTDFWRRWHITLSAWFRAYVYIPLGGSRRGVLRTVRNLLVVWALTGLWHGAGWNFLLWGLYYFILLAGEKFVWGRLHARLPAALRHAVTLGFVLLGWAFFACGSSGALAGYLGALFGAGGAWDAGTLYRLLSFGPLLLAASVGATHLPRALAEKALGARPRLRFAAEAVFAALAVGVSLVFLIGDSYNPFLYFRF